MIIHSRNGFGNDCYFWKTELELSIRTKSALAKMQFLHIIPRNLISVM